MEQTAKLAYTGHPLVDVGVATITAFANKDDPAEVTDEDLAKIADYMKEWYVKPIMRSFLSVVFTINCPFTNSTTGPEKRATDIERILYSWKEGIPKTDEQCVFWGTPAVRRAVREMIPLIGSEGGFNFYTGGISGLPVSGEALLAVHAFPLGCTKCSGRVLLLHADDNSLTYEFAVQSLGANRRYLDVAAQGGKFTDSKHPQTQIITRLVQAEQERRDKERERRKRPCSVTAYHLTNYGTSADVTIYHLPLQITDFLAQATDAAYREAWNRLVRRGWEGDNSTVDAPERDELGQPARRNVLYEDLFALPQDARRFLRTYLLRMPDVQRTRKDDQRRTYVLAKELDLVSWPLTRLFLERIMNVDKERIDAIRTMADEIASYIHKENDHRLFRVFLWGKNGMRDYHELRTRLINADYNAARQEKPLFDLDTFIAVFEQSDDRTWWIMARDLLLIRMIEKLHELGWIEQHRNVLTPPSEETSDQPEETTVS